MKFRTFVKIKYEQPVVDFSLQKHILFKNQIAIFSLARFSGEQPIKICFDLKFRDIITR